MKYPDCARRQIAVRDTLDIVGGKWKLVIMSVLADGALHRFRELQRNVGAITAGMLSKELKELEVHQLVSRTVLPITPVTVEYSLTDYGKSLEPVIVSMYEWGAKHRERMII